MPYRDLSDGQILAATGIFTQFRPTLFACQSHSFWRSTWQFLSRFRLLACTARLAHRDVAERGGGELREKHKKSSSV